MKLEAFETPTHPNHTSSWVGGVVRRGSEPRDQRSAMLITKKNYTLLISFLVSRQKKMLFKMFVFPKKTRAVCYSLEAGKQTRTVLAVCFPPPPNHTSYAIYRNYENNRSGQNLGESTQQLELTEPNEYVM